MLTVLKSFTAITRSYQFMLREPMHPAASVFGSHLFETGSLPCIIRLSNIVIIEEQIIKALLLAL